METPLYLFWGGFALFFISIGVIALRYALRSKKPHTEYPERGLPKFHNPPPPPAALPRAKPVLIKSLEHIFFDKFVKCAVDNDYSLLVVSGKPTKDELFAAWMELLSQHYFLIGSKEAAKYIRKVARLESINTKIHQVESIIQTLRKEYDERLAAQLRDIWGYKKKFTPESLLPDLQQVEIALGNDRFKLEKIRLEYEKDQKSGKSDKMTKRQWDELFLAVATHRKMSDMDRSRTTMYDFDILFNNLQSYNEQVKKITSK